MKIHQLARGYRYNTDTLLLADFAQRALLRRFRMHARPALALDICAGSGVIALLLARFFARQFGELGAFLRSCNRPASQHARATSQPLGAVKFRPAKKIRMQALDFQRINCALMGKNRHANAYKFDIFEANLSEFFPAARYEFIFCNPPFYSKQLPASEHLARSRHASFLPISTLFAAISRLLAPAGRAFLCYDAAALGEIFAAARAHKLHICRLQFAHGKPSAQANLALFELSRAGSDLRVLPPIICYENARATRALEAVYARAKLESIDICEEDL